MPTQHTPILWCAAQRQNVSTWHAVTADTAGVAMQDVYADLSNNLLVHVMVPALGLRSKQWTVISWARSQTARETLLDAKYVYRYAIYVRRFRYVIDQ